MYKYTPMTHNDSGSVGIIGATGYTGQELVGLIARHPGLELAFATSEADAGKSVPGARLTYVKAADAPLGDVDVVFSCLPTGESAPWALRAREAGARVVDLSADLREGQAGAVYGLPELWRSEVRGAELVANPGCYPTGILLGLMPVIRAGILDRSRHVIIDAASGVTGAGRAAKRDLLFGEVAEDYRAYGVGNQHRHVPEIGAGLGRMNGHGAPAFIFTPHLLPVRRGILETMYVPLTEPLSARAAVELWQDSYRDEQFVDVRAEGLPSLRDVIGRNIVAIGFSDVQSTGAPMLLVVAALDNLVKGAAGQALQNANVMLGLEEREGLPL
jgi:N-acetyl-gamma-glutamyl-phosphate reductase